MNVATQIKTIREGLGLSTGELAAALETSKRSVEHWESGRVSPREGTWQMLDELRQQAAEEVAEHITLFTAEGKTSSEHVPPMLLIEGERRGWQRAVAFRVMQAVPHLRVLDVEDAEGPPSEGDEAGAVSDE